MKESRSVPSLKLIGLPAFLSAAQLHQAARNNAALQKLFDELPHKTREQKLHDALEAMRHLHGVGPPARVTSCRAAPTQPDDDGGER